MIYPSNYTEIGADELVYLTGGTALDAFNYLFGDWLQSMVLGDVRNAVWNTAKTLKLDSVKSTGKNILSWKFPAQIAYGYGAYRLFQTVKAQFLKK